MKRVCDCVLRCQVEWNSPLKFLIGRKYINLQSNLEDSTLPLHTMVAVHMGLERYLNEHRSFDGAHQILTL
jgi:hypothetical protein